jgi:hypothetical protein
VVTQLLKYYTTDFVAMLATIDFDSLPFILHFLNQFWIASRSVCSFCEAMAGSLSVATAAGRQAKVAVVDSSVLGRSAVYSRYNNCPRTLLLAIRQSDVYQLVRPGVTYARLI